MSSTGKLSKVQGGEITSLSEASRQQSSIDTSNPGLLETPKFVNGIINEVHDTNLKIKAYDANDGSSVNSGEWIKVIHSPLEIVERFGTIRRGMKVEITYTGIQGHNARARVIREDESSTGTEEWELNEKVLGLWEIFR